MKAERFPWWRERELTSSEVQSSTNANVEVSDMNASEYFETRTRDDGTSFVTLKDDRPDWLYEAVRAAHDDELPNDWRYAMCQAIFQAFDDGEFDGEDSHQLADGLVSVYTSELIDWLTPNRLSLCDEAHEELCASDDDGLEARIATGQFYAIERMVWILWNAMQENAGESEDDESSSDDNLPTEDGQS